MTDHDPRVGSVIAAALSLLVLGAAVARADGLPILPTVPGTVAPDGHAWTELCGQTPVRGRLMTYSKAHRSGTAEASLRCPRGWQADHIVPLNAGGADDSKTNIWCEPPNALVGGWGWQTKDRADDWAYEQICRRHADPAAVQARFLAPADWRTFYCGIPAAHRLKYGPPCPVAKP